MLNYICNKDNKGEKMLNYICNKDNKGEIFYEV